MVYGRGLKNLPGDSAPSPLIPVNSVHRCLIAFVGWMSQVFDLIVKCRFFAGEGHGLCFFSSIGKGFAIISLLRQRSTALLVFDIRFNLAKI